MLPASATAPVAGAGGAGGIDIANGLMGAAKIQAGTALIGGAMQGKAAQQQRDFELQQAQAARDRYNANVGTQLWSPNQAPAASSAPLSPSGAYAYDPVAQAKSLSQQRWDEYQARQGLVSRNMA
jgi:hypothetical protein